MARKKRPDARAYKALVEKPEPFTIEGLDGKDVTLHLYPLQLARLMLISERLLDLDMVFDGGENDVKTMWKVCAEKADAVAEIIAIATLRTKQDIEERLQERIELLLHSPSMTPTAVTNLFMAIVFQSYYGDFLKAIRSVRTLQVEISPEPQAERIAMEVGAYGGR